MDLFARTLQESTTRKEMLKRRQLRLAQARKQAAIWTRESQEKFQEAKEEELRKLVGKLTEEEEQDMLAQVQEMADYHDEGLDHIGEAHIAAAITPNYEEIRNEKMNEYRKKARERFRAALATKRGEVASRQDSETRLQSIRTQLFQEANVQAKFLPRPQSTRLNQLAAGGVPPAGKKHARSPGKRQPSSKGRVGIKDRGRPEAENTRPSRTLEHETMRYKPYLTDLRQGQGGDLNVSRHESDDDSVQLLHISKVRNTAAVGAAASDMPEDGTDKPTGELNPSHTEAADWSDASTHSIDSGLDGGKRSKKSKGCLRKHSAAATPAPHPSRQRTREESRGSHTKLASKARESAPAGSSVAVGVLVDSDRDRGKISEKSKVSRRKHSPIATRAPPTTHQRGREELHEQRTKLASNKRKSGPAGSSAVAGGRVGKNSSSNERARAYTEAKNAGRDHTPEYEEVRDNAQQRDEEQKGEAGDLNVSRHESDDDSVQLLHISKVRNTAAVGANASAISALSTHKPTEKAKQSESETPDWSNASTHSIDSDRDRAKISNKRKQKGKGRRGKHSPIATRIPKTSNPRARQESHEPRTKLSSNARESGPSTAEVINTAASVSAAASTLSAHGTGEFNQGHREAPEWSDASTHSIDSYRGKMPKTSKGQQKKHSPIATRAVHRPHQLTRKESHEHRTKLASNTRGSEPVGSFTAAGPRVGKNSSSNERAPVDTAANKTRHDQIPEHNEVGGKDHQTEEKMEGQARASASENEESGNGKDLNLLADQARTSKPAYQLNEYHAERRDSSDASIHSIDSEVRDNAQQRDEEQEGEAGDLNVSRHESDDDSVQLLHISKGSDASALSANGMGKPTGELNQRHTEAADWSDASTHSIGSDHDRDKKPKESMARRRNHSSSDNHAQHPHHHRTTEEPHEPRTKLASHARDSGPTRVEVTEDEIHAEAEARRQKLISLTSPKSKHDIRTYMNILLNMDPKTRAALKIPSSSSSSSSGISGQEETKITLNTSALPTSTSGSGSDSQTEGRYTASGVQRFRKAGKQLHSIPERSGETEDKSESTNEIPAGGRSSSEKTGSTQVIIRVTSQPNTRSTHSQLSFPNVVAVHHSLTTTLDDVVEHQLEFIQQAESLKPPASVPAKSGPKNVKDTRARYSNRVSSSATHPPQPQQKNVTNFPRKK